MNQTQTPLAPTIRAIAAQLPHGSSIVGTASPRSTVNAPIVVDSRNAVGTTPVLCLTHFLSLTPRVS